VTFERITADLIPQIDAELREITRTPHHSLGSYYGMLHYHLGWLDEELDPIQTASGKRLRPLLCLLSCQALDGAPSHALPAACAIELIHNFSLVHDDIQDASHTRRGRRAVWDIWGLDQGINVGDGLFALAHLALHRLSDRAVPPSRQLAASRALNRACLALCEGQYFDMAFEELVNVDLDQYLWMIRRKTAALLAASTEIGASLATDDDGTIAQFYRFGEQLGLAFQIQDDLLGAWGDEQVTGKSAASDIRDKKKTIPVVFALNQQENRPAARRLAKVYSHPAPLDDAAIQLVLDILHEVDAQQWAEDLALSHYHQALQNLEDTGLDPVSLSSLRTLASSLLGRQA
jgi:geranylgeranyl diphosphate synthase type I